MIRGWIASATPAIATRINAANAVQYQTLRRTFVTMNFLAERLSAPDRRRRRAWKTEIGLDVGTFAF